ncbi:CDF family Co(II)/Ni(II) efflux transporter DmeF [Denitratisoma oestradiolicum]|uniref:Cobalt transporter n=1 Tax=Denitratisoma oestradiolicum TaxID=311182 RepID=A0A6S6XSN9_9PROT|nr:CDF family Co(II)/Ni(II) efflux transporter DmeF [Denitratisoma oestradiolicum]TWO81059.1 cation transporter [Denitratisoma oestradiolicum]CAB1367730.1 Cobalt transporter [Denitratisoma oestradiolicum]
MHTHDLTPWTHHHIFDRGNRAAERGTRRVMAITALMMVLEIIAGWWFNSMALLADGWHMSSHALAIGLAALAYWAARRYAHDPRFAFGTWKIEVLAGFVSAMLLLGVAAAMVVGSLERLITPTEIHFVEAIAVAMLGLGVNVVCALILGNAHDHHHDDHHHHGHDLNLRSAYLHVIADAATSVLAIAALLGGLLLGWSWLDPLMGIVGAVLVAIWALGLIRETGQVLLDREMHHPVVDEIRAVITGHPSWQETTRIADLHVWRVGHTQYSVIISLVTHDPTLTPVMVKQQLAEHQELVHVSVEVNRCEDI